MFPSPHPRGARATHYELAWWSTPGRAYCGANGATNVNRKIGPVTADRVLVTCRRCLRLLAHWEAKQKSGKCVVRGLSQQGGVGVVTSGGPEQ